MEKKTGTLFLTSISESLWMCNYSTLLKRGDSTPKPGRISVQVCLECDLIEEKRTTKKEQY